MTPNATVVALTVLVVAAGTVLIGVFGMRLARGTSDFLVASRTVGSGWNATAVAGEYLSAASFLSIAGLVLRDGPSALWFAIAATTGFVALLLFVAAPLRRSGAYTVPDFAEMRLGSVRVRRIAAVLVVAIGWVYLVALFKGAGLTLSTVTGLPTWIGAATVAGVVALNVVSGGMRSVTLVQTFQYWFKLAALAVPVFVLLIFQFAEQPEFQDRIDAPAPPTFVSDTTVEVRTDVVLEIGAPTRLVAHGEVDGLTVNGPVYWNAGLHRVEAGTTLRFQAGTPVPVPRGAPVTNAAWLQPQAHETAGSLYQLYSLFIAGALGVVGLPHVLTRLYTNPDGRTTRRTTVSVLGLLGVFYLFVMLSGALARLYVPRLLVSSSTDAAVLLMPTSALAGWPAQVLAALVAAGAFAAFVSTASGLLVATAGVVSTDVLPGRVRDFRLAAVVVAAVPFVLALGTTPLDIVEFVALGFAVAASSFGPLLILGIWWRGLTDAGATAGLVAGGGLAIAAVIATQFDAIPDVLSPILIRPAAITATVAFVTMIVVSRYTPHRAPADVSRLLLRMHAPDQLGLIQDRDIDRFGPTLPEAWTLQAGRHRRGHQ